MFVVLEGPNGVGKTSVARRLSEHLEVQGNATVVLSQPSRGPVGLMAREREHELVGWPLAALVVADRYLQLREEIEPALAAGKAVILDRYVASTLVLQRLDGLDPRILWEMNAAVLRPNLTVVLQAGADTLRARLRDRARLSRFEQMPDGVELELRYFAEAADQLEAHGYEVLRLDTTDSAMEAVVVRILKALDARRG
jgi:dTMP kinase